MAGNRDRYQLEHKAVELPIWQELLAGIEIVYLRASPIYYGFGVPHGDGSAVVVIPGFLGTDFYLTEFCSWLRRIGYKAYFSGIGLNAECPNLLIRSRLDETIQKAYKTTGRKIHLIGHSLGGVRRRSAVPLAIPASCAPPRPCGTASCASMETMSCLIAIPASARAISWTR